MASHPHQHPRSLSCQSNMWISCLVFLYSHDAPTPAPWPNHDPTRTEDWAECAGRFKLHGTGSFPKKIRTSMTSIWSAFFRRRSQVLFHHRVIFGSCWNCACESFFRLCPETKFTPIPGLKPRGPIGPSDFSSKKYRMGPPSYNLIYKPWNNPH